MKHPGEFPLRIEHDGIELHLASMRVQKKTKQLLLTYKSGDRMTTKIVSPKNNKILHAASRTTSTKMPRFFLGLFALLFDK